MSDGATGGVDKCACGTQFSEQFDLAAVFLDYLGGVTSIKDGPGIVDNPLVVVERMVGKNDSQVGFAD